MKPETQLQFLQVSINWILTMLDSLEIHAKHLPTNACKVQFEDARRSVRVLKKMIEYDVSLDEVADDPEEQDYEARGVIASIEEGERGIRVDGAELLKPGDKVLVMGRSGRRWIERIGRIVSRTTDENGTLVAVYKIEHQAAKKGSASSIVSVQP